MSAIFFTGYNFTSDNIANDVEKGKTYHKMIETFKYAYARRALLGDKNYANISKVSKRLLYLFSEKHYQKLRIKANLHFNIKKWRPFLTEVKYSGNIKMKILLIQHTIRWARDLSSNHFQIIWLAIY